MKARLVSTGELLAGQQGGEGDRRNHDVGPKRPRPTLTLRSSVGAAVLSAVVATDAFSRMSGVSLREADVKPSRRHYGKPSLRVFAWRSPRILRTIP